VATICVFCASATAIDERWLELGREVGAAIAARGHRLVSGGGCVGMMGTVAAGARAGGAHTLGVIPQRLVELEVADSDADELIITDDMTARKLVMMERAEAYLVLPGGLGTLDELFEVWTTATLGLHATPIVLLDADGFYDGLMEWLRGLVDQKFVRPEAFALVQVARTLDEALDVIERFV